MTDTLEQLADELLSDKIDYDNLCAEDLISGDLFASLMSIDDAAERTRAESRCMMKARELHISREYERCYKAYRQSIAKQTAAATFGNVTDFYGAELTLNCGDWVANNSGVKRMKTLPSGGTGCEYASAIPILPTEILTNVDTEIEKVKLSFYKNEWKSVICDRTIAASSSKIIDLAGKGVEVNSENSKLLVKYIADCVALNQDIIPQRKSISHMGWYKNNFIPYNKEFVFDGEREYKPIYDAICTGGDFEKWKQYVGGLRKNLTLRLAMAAAFASPLLSLLGALPFVFHLWGGSGSGKSVAAMAAMSIWGYPAIGTGLVRTVNNTVNAMMSTAAFLRDIPVAFDELQTIKSRYENYDKLIMNICEGVDRGRMTYDKINDTKVWNCAFIFTGEEPVTQSSSGGGAKNRVIEIECTKKIIENGVETANFLRDNYGYAGAEYLNFVNANRSRIKDLYGGIQKTLFETDTTEKQALSMAAMMTGDALGSACFFPGEAPLTVDDVMPYLRTKSEVDVSERAFDFVQDMIAVNDERFRADINGDIRGEIWGKIDGEDAIFINKSVLIKLMRGEGFEFDAVKSAWADKGYLIKNSQGKMLHCTKCHGVKGAYIKLIIR